MSEVPSLHSEIRFLAKTLSAAILYPNVDHDVKRARDIAEELVAAMEYVHERQELARCCVDIEKGWEEGVKIITGTSRLPRAVKKFDALVERHSLKGLMLPETVNGLPTARAPADWRDQGFTRAELEGLKELYELTLKSSYTPQKPRKRAKVYKKSSRAAKN